MGWRVLKRGPEGKIFQELAKEDSADDDGRKKSGVHNRNLASRMRPTPRPAPC